MEIDALLSAETSAPVTQWPQRLGLTLLLAGVIALCIWGMWRNWRKRIGRQNWVELEPAPDQRMGANNVFKARYVASVRTEDWMDRIAAKGLGMPGQATISVVEAGLIIDRVGEVDVFLPGSVIEEVASARGIAQEVYERDGIVAITWRSGDRRITTGLRLPSAEEHVALLAAVENLIGKAGA